MTFQLPWIDPRDVTYLGRGRWFVECIWFEHMFVQNIEVILGRDAYSFRPEEPLER